MAGREPPVVIQVGKSIVHWDQGVGGVVILRGRLVCSCSLGRWQVTVSLAG